MNNSFFNSLEIIKALIRWRKHLIVVGIISLAASYIFSAPFFIKPKFKSFAIAYPSNLMAYSTESATEQMLQLTQSSDIRDKIIRTFNLYDHYKIDTLLNPHYNTEVIQIYNENVQIRKTEYESMEITVFDTDPLIASAIVDSLIHFFDVKARQLQSQKSHEVMVIFQDQLNLKQAEMDSMESRLRDIRMNYGLLEFKEQSQEATRGYLKNLSTGNSRGINESKKLLDALQEKGGELNALSEHLWRVRGTYNDLKIAYENARTDVVKNLTYANVVTHPHPSDTKSYPIRWLIVLISVGSSLLLAFMILLIFDSRKHISN